MASFALVLTYYGYNQMCEVLYDHHLYALFCCRECNGGFHPLKGAHMTISFFGIIPSLYVKEGGRLEGIDIDILDIIAHKYKFSYDTLVANNWFKFFPNGTIGGSLGHVCTYSVQYVTVGVTCVCIQYLHNSRQPSDHLGRVHTGEVFQWISIQLHL